MMTNDYLYGKDVEVPEIPQEVIVRRLEALNDNLAELLKVTYLGRDSARVRRVQKAIDFWEKINDV